MTCLSPLRKPLVLLGGLFSLVPALPLPAQLPSESLLVVNGSSVDAIAVAETYAELRGFPKERILNLRPDKEVFRTPDGSPRWALHEKRARELWLDPLRERLDLLDDPGPTALILSPDWPTRVILKDKPSVSVTAFLGTLGDLPDEGIKHGKAISPWYIHPPESRAGTARLWKYPASTLKNRGHHPAAMLGVLYKPLDRERIQTALKRAVRADHTRPQGAVAIVTNNNVRSRARQDQFAPAKEALEALDVPVILGDKSADLPDELLGVMTGAASVNVDRYRGKLVPGAFAEHLTSFAAKFDTPGQTKLTEWIDAGAAGSVGTVTEPFAIWTKFPRAAVFERYRGGHTLLESLTQSIASPYQSLIVGDPLCRPWGRELAPLSLDARWEGDTLHVAATAGHSPNRTDRHLFLNGRRVDGDGPEWALPFDTPPKRPVELILHARHNWAPPETGFVRKTVAPRKP